MSRSGGISQTRAKAALAMLLAACSRDKLASFTAAGLAGSYNVPIADAEKMLARARQGAML